MMLNKLFLTLLVLLLTGCATRHSGIGSGVNYCCTPTELETIEVVADDIPAFLDPLMVSNFSVAIAHKGLNPVAENGDVIATLSFERQELSAERDRDDFEERIATGNAARFIAQINIEMTIARTGELIWSGHIERLHNVGPGDWMHTGKASVAIYDSFVELLENADLKIAP